MNELLIDLNDWHAPAVLAVVGGLLILADYLFDTDIPAHIGYACFAVAAFLMGPASLRDSFFVAALVWSLLINVHFLVLRRFLERDVDEVSEPSAGERSALRSDV